MAEQSKPNTFSAGMITDLDPAYQSKESYYTAENIRVVTNGDNSYSLENIKSPSLKFTTNVKADGSFNTGSARYYIFGATVVEDYVVTIERNTSQGLETWRIRKYNIADDGSLSLDGGPDSYLWDGEDLFSDNAEKIEMESAVETENVHRVYCTDGITGLKSINVKDANIASSTVSDFLAFKPNPKSQIKLEEYVQNGGNLLYGAYSYVYRLSSQGQTNYTDWSSVSRPINVVKGNLSVDTSLQVSGGVSTENSSTAIRLSIAGIPYLNYDQIEVAAIFYPSENVSSISIIEKSPLSSSNHTFTHSGFETQIPVEGGIAAAIISNKTWNVCKTLAKKDNKLYAGNLKSETLDIDDIVNGFGKLKSWKALPAGSAWNFYTYTGDFNPHRHYNGSGGNFSWHEDFDSDKAIYKFIPKDWGDDGDGNTQFVLGAETEGFSTGGFGFRITFDHKPYRIDQRFNKVPGGGFPVNPTTNQDANELYFTDSSNNDINFGGFKRGPHNPVWDFNYRSFKRGECYRFGVVFYDLQGAPGFVHYLGDVKMPDALDPNKYALNGFGSTAHITTKANGGYNSRWSPFSSGATEDDVWAYALIPRMEAKFPYDLRSKISGFKIVRAEISENDRTIITQGALSTIEGLEDGYGNSTLQGKATYPPVSLTIQKQHNGFSGYPQRIRQQQYVIDGSDTTFRGINYNFNTGVSIKPLYPLIANRVSNDVTQGNNHKHFGYDLNTDMATGGQGGTGFMLYKWKPYSRITSNTHSQTDIAALLTTSDENLFRWHRPSYFAKTVVNNEIITQTQNGLGIDYIHNGPGYDGNDQFDNDLGDFYPSRYDDESRAQYRTDVTPSLYFSVGPSGGNVPLLSQIKFGGTNNQSLSEYPASSPNNHHSPATGSSEPHWSFLGFKWMVEVVRNTQDGFEQYGGATDAAVKSTKFIDCSSYQSQNSNTIAHTFEIDNGDVFCDWYSVKNTSRNENISTFIQGNLYPLESYVNVALRQGTYLGVNQQASMVVQDNFLYNTAYSQENNIVSSVVKPSGFQKADLFKSKIAASRTKILGELYDAWSVFPANDFIELDLGNGKITDLINYKNQLYAVQERGISFLSINTRSLIQGEGAAADIQIVTGTGTAIERYDYITTQFGSQHFNEAIVTPTGFYFFDADKSDILKCDGRQVAPMALSNQYKSFIENITQNSIFSENSYGSLGDLEKGLCSGYDSEFRECYYSIVNASGFYIFTFSDLDGKLISNHSYKNNHESVPNQFYDLVIKRFIPYKNKLYILSNNSINIGEDSVTDGIYRLNEGLYEDFKFGYIVNDSSHVTKVFDSSEIFRRSGFQPSKFASHILSTDLNITTTHSVPESNERIREGKSMLALRSEDGNRVRGSWMKHTIAYSQPLVNNGNTYDPAFNKKFDIFAINTRYRESR